MSILVSADNISEADEGHGTVETAFASTRKPNDSGLLS